MIKFVLIFMGVLSLGACEDKTVSDNVVTHHCGEYDIDMKVSDDGSTMQAVINGDALDLKLAVSASGTRYVGVLNDTDVTLWGQGNGWTLFLNDEAPIECDVK